jgi:hypothetical protein
MMAVEESCQGLPQVAAGRHDQPRSLQSAKSVQSVAKKLGEKRPQIGADKDVDDGLLRATPCEAIYGVVY